MHSESWIRVLDVNGYAADVFYVLLLYSGQYEFLPELFDVLGRERTMQILEVFAGTTIKFPSIRRLKRLAAEVRIYLRVKNSSKNPRHRAVVIHDLADEYQMTEESIRTIYERTSKLIEGDLGMEVLRAKRRRS